MGFLKNWLTKIEDEAEQALAKAAAADSDSDMEQAIQHVADAVGQSASDGEITASLEEWFATTDGFKPANDGSFQTLVNLVRSRLADNPD